MTGTRSKTALADWIKRQVPSREQLEEIRLIRPLARRAELFRLTRRSVPRGVAIGLLVGIFALIPGVQIVGAALMCVPFRGNIPLAAGMTFLSNPATTPLILAASLYIGSWLGFHADMATFMGMYEHGASMGAWTKWLLSDAAPALMLGLFVIASVAAVIGYVITSFIWRNMVARKRRYRLANGIAPAEMDGESGGLTPAE
ncbi:DUF2062 domain-containing protein [Altererythrobacter sp. CC-YST694]|uniref:DUF2062 domain-containing protein n=1 Tax=Altererythrobacter sp. CC-YST694 TaxID=2755038 RepID=UPI001D010ADA|nr:DUF2062 domain-containing protein [Altererythrobacter sp. CC-YST694]MCB5424211.1 DUF2062 domain-containing protein [Altererythrobacter sp. CC-YST694]